jgi:hypothetical protein
MSSTLNIIDMPDYSRRIYSRRKAKVVSFLKGFLFIYAGWSIGFFTVCLLTSLFCK